MAQSCACHAVCDRRIHVNNVIPTVYQGRVISTSLSAILASRGSYTLNQGTAGPREFHKLIVEAEKFPRRAGQPGARNWLSCSVITCPVWKMVTYSHWLNQTRNKYPCCLPDLETVEDSGIYKVFLPTLAFSLFPSSLPQNTYCEYRLMRYVRTC